MLFDLENDLAEQKNVAKKNPDVVAKFKKIFDDAHTPSPLINWKN